MPLYEWVCDDCGAVEEVIVPTSQRDDAVTCAVCAESMRRLVGAPKPHGILWSKPLIIPHAAAAFTTNQQLRDYEAGLEEDGMRIISANSKDWEAHYDKAASFAEKRAKARGYNDFEDQCRQRRKETARRNKLAKESGKTAPSG